MNKTRILQEALMSELIPVPRKVKTPENVDHNRHCKCYRNHGHSTEECVALKDQIEELIQARQLKHFVGMDEGMAG